MTWLLIRFQMFRCYGAFASARIRFGREREKGVTLYRLKVCIMYCPYRSLHKTPEIMSVPIQSSRLQPGRYMSTHFFMSSSKKRGASTYMEYWMASRAASAGRNSLTATSLFSFFLSERFGQETQLNGGVQRESEKFSDHRAVRRRAYSLRRSTGSPGGGEGRAR